MEVPALSLSFLPLLAWGAYSYVQARINARSPDFNRAAAPVDPVTLVRVSIAFDAGARAQLQRALDASMPVGALPHQVVGTVAELLVREIAHAKMFAVGVSKVFGRDEARTIFHAELRRLAARCTRDALAVRAGTGKRAPFRVGGGYVVVTLCIARSAELLLRSGAGATLADLCVVLNVLCSAARDETLLSECVWAPSDADDVMSMGEMLAAFPELAPVAEGISGGDFCLSLCPFCQRTYSAEAEACPHCRRPSHAQLATG